ncbi:MAG: DUF423 domain-containing protein [bacterium]|nr:DUF423 domain-containing protein [bacterium]
MARLWLMMAAANGFLAVALGAFGAHGLKRMLEAAPDGALRLQWWQTAAQYHLAHALALGLVAALAPHLAGRLPGVAGWLFVAGIILFSGSLYVMTLTGVRALGAITPVGGVCLLGGWLVLFLAAVRLR